MCLRESRVLNKLFSLSKLRYKKKINDTNSRHVKLLSYEIKKKKKQVEGKSKVSVN